MRKPTFTIDLKAYSSTLDRTFSSDQRPGLPTPVPTPRRTSTDVLDFVPPKSFIGDVQDALKRTFSNKTPASVPMGLRKPSGAKEKSSTKWAARLGLSSSVPKMKTEPDKKP